MGLMTSHGELDEESIKKDARSKAESRVREWHDEITQLAGESPPYEYVSSELVTTCFGFVPRAETNPDS